MGKKSLFHAWMSWSFGRPFYRWSNTRLTLFLWVEEIENFPCDGKVLSLNCRLAISEVTEPKTRHVDAKYCRRGCYCLIVGGSLLFSVVSYMC